MELTYKNEKKLFLIILIFSLLLWALIVVGTVGIALIYLLFGFLIYLFVQSAFISYIKGTGVKISEQQFPELYAQYKECCQRLNISNQPELYILNSDGILNALATRFLKRHYVVLYSSIIDALKKYPDGVNFYIGHELGHIKKGHLNWTTLIFPGSLLPLIGAAYSRAREYTCDLHGLHCCKQTKDAVYAMAVLATGAEFWSKLNVSEYMRQSKETGSFWMSFHEYTGDYPWLCKRMQHIVDSSKGQKKNVPNRNLFAGFLALFVPRLGIGSAAGNLISVMVVVAVIGILAAVAIPAYQQYTVRAKIAGVEEIANKIKERATPYIIQHSELPYNLQILNLPIDLSNEVVESVEVTDSGFVLHTRGTPQLKGKTVIYQPFISDNNQLNWRCNTGTLNPKYLPSTCNY